MLVINDKVSRNPVYPIIFAISTVHLLNDTLQAVIPAMFPILAESMALNYTQLGLIAFILNMVASVFQPVVGFFSDRKPKPFALPFGMTLSFIGIAGLAFAPEYWVVLVSVVFLGLGSAIFHPEGSRVAFLASGSKRGLSQSIFQVGGNTGQALAPLISAFVLVPLGQIGAALFLLAAALGIYILRKVSLWYRDKLEQDRLANRKKVIYSSLGKLTKKQVGTALSLLILIIFARSFYVTNITSFYVFYLMEDYSMTIQQGQLFIFLFLAMGAVGTLFGGPMADRIGRKNLILLSAVVPIPLSIALPLVSTAFIAPLLILIGFFIMSSFSVTVVYAQELVPSKIGTMAGLTVGFAFGMGAIGAVVIGILIDKIGIYSTMILISYLPIIGIIGYLLPKDQKIAASVKE